MTPTSPTPWNSDATIIRPDGRTVGFAEFGTQAGTPVLWCHGAPGSRLEPSRLRRQAQDHDFHIVCVDRPGYGASTSQPGRTLRSWLLDGIAVADALSIERFYTVGVSTGGAYALALAALYPERVLGSVVCCAMTDMRFRPARDTMHPAAVHAVWAAPDRAAALRIAADALGQDGSKLLEVFSLHPSDALFQDPEFLAGLQPALTAQFSHGVEGYADDRIADGAGWTCFDPSHIACPVTILHGASDTVVDVIHAQHTAEMMPTARLRIVEDLGHLSIHSQIVPALSELRDVRPSRAAI